MFGYDKRVAYLYYIKGSERIRTVGYARLIIRGSSFNWEIRINELREAESGSYEIQIPGCPSGTRITLSHGQADYKKKQVLDTAQAQEALNGGIKIILSQDSFLEAEWTQEQAAKQILRPVPQPEKPETEGQAESERIIQKPQVQMKSAELKEEEPEERKVCREAKELITFSLEGDEFYTDKWEELCREYKVVHPFGNDEQYLSLSPKDFIILPEKYQHLVNNSFLLHGYYNYRHIILGKKMESGHAVYYLGVPGVYYEREKMVAIMFGFEGFECGNKKAANGGFGYYMRRVEL